MNRFNLLLLTFLLPFAGVSQINGKIYSATDSVALEGVSVYFDGTSLGTVTNARGEFRLQETAATSPLVVSFLGYENLIIDTSQKGENLGALYLHEKTEQLGEVLIEPDIWSREKKMRHFKREFLGSTAEALKCRIKNEEIIELHYSPSRKVLTAFAPEPLVIINRHLGYELEYNLASFTIEFSVGSSGLSFTRYVAMEGTSFFKELRKRPRKKVRRNRQSSYTGSTLHFMRSLATRTLEENSFQIFVEGFLAPTYQHFSIVPKNGYTEINFLVDKVSVLFRGIEQTDIQALGPFVIDELGNHTPPLALLLTGEMSQQRIAHLLPLNYFPANQ